MIADLEETSIREWKQEKLSDADTYWFYMYPELLACFIFVISKQPEDCFHCFNRVQHITYSRFQLKRKKLQRDEPSQALVP